ncbi:hypothetical protein NLU13_8621 [Sarocladium strictum]|uniref:Nephrocystin 3-like N-terminal domain-containing protein n=1 Tax=Sarocladium strictum TaxID=5046 RepID=A0AA39GC12_SARSR|nr:hypothetical protein NLU13_8621 [Sarocladium strictum]
MVLYDGLDMLIQSGTTPRLDLVFVHGLGLGPENTWHDDSSGKNWIEEADFVLGLGWRVRVMSFRYNSDIASNMSAASIAIHANDLLYHLEKAMAKSDNIGLFFIAHGLGGAIVKKALRVRDLASNCPRVRDATTGVVFFGTPHADTNSDALLQTVRNTVQLLRRDHHAVDDDDIRHFSAAVSSINSTYISTKPRALQSISYWEEQESTWKSADGVECSGLIVPKSCRKPELWNNMDTSIDCQHLELPHFPSMFDPRFTRFTNDFTGLVNRVLEHKSVVIKPVKSASGQSPSVSGAAPSSRNGGRRTKSGRARSARRAEGTDYSDTEDELFSSWQKRKQYEENRSRLDGFLQSLKGWSPDNTGHDVFVATGTCEWILSSQALSTWLDFVLYGTFFWLAAPGSGKTHIAKALSAHIERTNPDDVVLSFFCRRNEPTPRIWEYFTWYLLQARPSWFNSTPKRYQGRDGNSEPLALGDYVDIWTAFRQFEGDDDKQETVWLVIDGLEACGDEPFFRFWSSLEQLRKCQADSRKPLCSLKVLFTGTLTPAMAAVAGGVSRYFVSSEFIKQDIARHVDARLNRCIDGESLLDVKDNVETLRQEIKDVAGDYWPFARDATAEVEATTGRDRTKIRSFRGRLPHRLEKHVQQVLLSLRQSVGPARYLYPILGILVSCRGGQDLNVYQLKDALSFLYGSDQMHKVDVADLVLRHAGGLLTCTATGFLTFCHSSFAEAVGRDTTESRRKANLAYLCIGYLLQDRFKTMPLPSQFTDPLDWLNENHPFYPYAVRNCVGLLAGSNGEDERLPSLFLRFFLERPPQWRAADEWLKACPDYTPNDDDFDDLALGLVIQNESLLPLLRRVCPPPEDLSTLSLLQRSRHRWTAWRRPSDGRTPRHTWPAGWLESQSRRGYSPLLAAARQGNVGLVRYILQWNPNVNERGGPAMSPILMMLYRSSTNGNSDQRLQRLTAITKDLLERGANINLSDARGSVPLHVACDQASLPLTRLVLDHGAIIDVADQDGCTPWQIACERGSPDLLRELLSRGVDADTLFSSGETALTFLTRRGWINSLRVVLEAADVNLVDRTGFSAVHRAMQTEGGRYEVLDLLISQPAIDLDVMQSRIHGNSNPERATALLIAVSTNDHRAAEKILGAGASAGSLPGLRVLPLELAARHGNRGIAELLLRHRAPVNEFLITTQKRTALATAAAACDVDMLQLLLDHGADPTVEDGLQLPNAAHLVLGSPSPTVEALKLLFESPSPPSITQTQCPDSEGGKTYSDLFIRACGIKDIAFIQVLLDSGIELRTWLDIPGTPSPLHAAVRSGNIEGCRLLLEKEPRFLDMFCRSGAHMFTPLHDACFYGEVDIAKLLLDKGADVKLLTPQEEKSCLLLACLGAHSEMIKVILAADPSMVHVPSYLGSSPLQVCSVRGLVKVAEELIKAGASPTTCHHGLYASISPTLFRTLGPQAVPLLRMYIKHGLNVNVPFNSYGHTPFDNAIRAAHPTVIRWMLKQGGHVVQRRRFSQKPEYWDSQLSNLGKHLPPDVIALLLTSHRNCLPDMDWQKQNALGDFGVGRPYLSEVYWLCEEIRAETSQDVFADMMVEPDLYGISPVERSIGVKGCRAESRVDVVRTTVDLIDAYLLTGDRTILAKIKVLLVAKLKYHIPEDLAPILTLRYSAREIMLLPDDQGEVQSSVLKVHRCLTCRAELLNKCASCVQCGHFSCARCLENEQQSSCGDAKEHLWIEFTLDVGVTFTSDVVAAALGRVKTALQLSSDGGSQESLGESIETVNLNDEASRLQTRLQSSLQLAALHAFNMLAVRRPIGTKYLPLSMHALELISPFERNIAQVRKWQDRRMLDGDMTMERRMEEMRYMSIGMGRTAYADEELFRREMILEDMTRLFSEDQTAI